MVSILYHFHPPNFLYLPRVIVPLSLRSLGLLGYIAKSIYPPALVSFLRPSSRRVGALHYRTILVLVTSVDPISSDPASYLLPSPVDVSRTLQVRLLLGPHVVKSSLDRVEVSSIVLQTYPAGFLLPKGLAIPPLEPTFLLSRISGCAGLYILGFPGLLGLNLNLDNYLVLFSTVYVLLDLGFVPRLIYGLRCLVPYRS